MTTRTYKFDRRPAPELRDILSQRAAGYGFAQIADAFGVHRRTVYLAIDRAADRGELPPALLWVLFPEDEDARRRLFSRIRSARARGVEVAGWDQVERARAAYARRTGA
ncbi:hypothetical protein JYK14_07755 [Siccirubricoccus sp. KC 17139]|uniref:Helix-turn-helix domain-containing protein n=1 Tax=Siccirubricoccus soli TaxID=2899147 RepID=A0ABT1D2B3_9PROT|nr:helix-turn-helix domain-containing protein [Siccirubricoccus soli]MCO6416064.1 hypothetical protein [Siccirubricoccus soli]MCP2682196.1 hypothetical protein [Siccirubricoccus soli]